MVLLLVTGESCSSWAGRSPATTQQSPAFRNTSKYLVFCQGTVKFYLVVTIYHILFFRLSKKKYLIDHLVFSQSPRGPTTKEMNTFWSPPPPSPSSSYIKLSIWKRIKVLQTPNLRRCGLTPPPCISLCYSSLFFYLAGSLTKPPLLCIIRISTRVFQISYPLTNQKFIKKFFIVSHGLNIHIILLYIVLVNFIIVDHSALWEQQGN